MLSVILGSIAGFIVGFVGFPLLLFVLRDVLPPTLFTPSDWD